MSRYSEIQNAYHFLGKEATFYDGMITCSALPGRVVCGLVWNMERAKNTHCLASGKHIAPEVVKKMIERSLYHVRWYFSRTNLNIPQGKAQHKTAIMAYCKWYTPERERSYLTSFKVDFEGQPYDGACCYRITRCPICAYARRRDVMEIMPLLCELDEVMIRLQHGILHREQMIAAGGAYCDYFVVGDKES